MITVEDLTGRLLPGRWYIGVIHKTGALATYTLCAETVPGTVRPIQPDVLYSNNVVNFNGVDYYRVIIAATPFSPTSS